RTWERLVRWHDLRVKTRQTYSFLDQLEESQWWASEAIEQLQRVRLESLMASARDGSAYWRHRLPQNAFIHGQKSARECLAEIPVLEREDLRQSRDQMPTIPTDRLIRRSTGGSTGQPVQFYCDPSSEQQRMAASFRGYRWAGLGPAVPQLYLWGIPPRAARLKRLEGWRNEAYHYLNGRIPYSLFELSELRLKSLANLARRFNVR